MRRAWWLLTAIVLVIPAAFVPVALLHGGPWRWAIIGASVASGLWLAILTTVLNSGAAGALMGATAERWTADDLRSLRRHGWRLVNGLKLRPRADIDHIAVGPRGVFVMETKWSEDAWPLSGAGGGFMVHRLASAVEQVGNGRDVAKHFRRDIAGAPLQAVLVLWSASPSPEMEDWIEENGVTVVRGRALLRWLETTDQSLDGAGVARIWAAFEKQARLRDERDELSSGPPKPTVEQLWYRWVLQPVLGFLAAGYTIVLISWWFHEWWTILSAELASLLVGIKAHRFPPLRWLAVGWILAFAVVLLAFPVLVLVHQLR